MPLVHLLTAERVALHSAAADWSLVEVVAQGVEDPGAVTSAMVAVDAVATAAMATTVDAEPGLTMEERRAMVVVTVAVDRASMQHHRPREHKNHMFGSRSLNNGALTGGTMHDRT